MKKLGILFASVFLLGLVFQSCNNGKTYAEMKEEEREAIKRFIEREDINVISFEQFQEQDSTTNVDENQFVLFSETGVYMQIVAEGNGERLKGPPMPMPVANFNSFSWKPLDIFA